MIQRATSILVLAVLWCGALPVSAGPPESDKLVLVVPLDKDGSYCVHDVLRACNQTFKTSYPLERIENRRIAVTPEWRRGLALVSLTGLDRKLGITVRVEPSKIELHLPDPESEAARQKVRGF